MNWEDSNACTPLKRDFLRLWFAQEQRFFLTGGSALGLFYLDHRRSYDLDLFTSDEVKDVVDLYFLEQAGHDILAAIPDAKAKDGGWDPAVVSMLLDGLDPTELPPWLLRDLAPRELQAFLHRLRLAFASQALPES